MEQKKLSKLKILIIVLVALIVLSTGGLVARLIYLANFERQSSTNAVPDNNIGHSELSGAVLPQYGSRLAAIPALSAFPLNISDAPKEDEIKRESKTLELTKSHPGDNERFEVSNMFPGDCITKYYCVKAYHKSDIILYYKTVITEQTKNLGDVLHIKVSLADSGKVICDDSFANLNGREFSEILAVTPQKVSETYFRIDVSLDTSVGNEYQASMLKADFIWYAADEPEPTAPTESTATEATDATDATDATSPTIPTGETSEPSETSATDATYAPSATTPTSSTGGGVEGLYDPVKTGDVIVMVPLLIAAAALMLLIFFFAKRRREGDSCETDR